MKRYVSWHESDESAWPQSYQHEAKSGSTDYLQVGVTQKLGYPFGSPHDSIVYWNLYWVPLLLGNYQVISG